MSDLHHIFINEDFKNQLSKQTQKLESSLLIYSAFVKTSALRWLKSVLPENINVSIVARWQPNDLAMHASDLDAYDFCKENQWSFGIQNSLHSKVFIFDNKTVLLGSANLTDRGLSISGSGNLEVGTVIEANIQDLQRLQRLEEGVVWLDDSLHQQISDHITSIESSQPRKLSWSHSLQKVLEKPIEYMWVNELLWSDPDSLLFPDLNNEDVEHDIHLLNLDIEYISKELLDQKFINSNLYKFLVHRLENASTQYTNFGWVTEMLHNAVLDSPPPQRIDIKHYVAQLFSWLEFSQLSCIALTHYERTISLSLKQV